MSEFSVADDFIELICGLIWSVAPLLEVCVSRPMLDPPHCWHWASMFFVAACGCGGSNNALELSYRHDYSQGSYT